MHAKSGRIVGLPSFTGPLASDGVYARGIAIGSDASTQIFTVEAEGAEPRPIPRRYPSLWQRFVAALRGAR